MKQINWGIIRQGMYVNTKADLLLIKFHIAN